MNFKEKKKNEIEEVAEAVILLSESLELSLEAFNTVFRYFTIGIEFFKIYFC